MTDSAERLVATLREQGLTIAFAESCTAGLAASMVADVPGASKVLWGGVVAYTWDAKEKLLGVRQDTLENYGAVSRETALEMARGVLAASGADLAAAVTGLAGPDGDGENAPVGTVWFAAVGARSKGVVCAVPITKLSRYTGLSRNALRKQAAKDLLEWLIKLLK
jgi:PncC family amidohydrolase